MGRRIDEDVVEAREDGRERLLQLERALRIVDELDLDGDEVLRRVAAILGASARKIDIVARYGGEEFVAILENCGLPEAARLADEVRRELEARSVPGADGRPLRATVSAGCAVLYASDPTREALLGRADAGLYMAKEAGRNRVVAT